MRLMQPREKSSPRWIPSVTLLHNKSAPTALNMTTKIRPISVGKKLRQTMQKEKFSIRKRIKSFEVGGVRVIVR